MLLYSFSIQNKHLIRRLIVLEGLMLITIVYLFFILSLVSFSGLLLLRITFAASEAALGLSLLIEIIRLYSNDKRI